MPRESTGKNWVVVWNNYPADYRDVITTAIDAFNDDDSHPNRINYFLSGEEVASTGTPHLQAFVNFEYPIALSRARLVFPCHFEIAKKIRNYLWYCKKGTQSKQEWDSMGRRGLNYGVGAVVWEFGSMPEKQQGERSDLADFRAHVRSVFDNGGWFEQEDAREEFPEIAAKYWTFVLQTINDLKPYRTVDAHPLRPWQQELNQKLNLEATDRNLHFIIDTTGNSGKSWFAKYYRQLHPKYDVQIIHPGKNGDIKMLLRESARVLFVDIPRCQSEHFPWGVLEKIKDGEDMSGKYYPTRISMKHKHVHICVMTNTEPDSSIFSEDRCDITRL